MDLDQPGICLTLDDLFVAGWLKARAVFDAFGARATFCVSRLHLARPYQIDGLHLLQDEGHEIGFHTRTHPKLRSYLAEHGLEHWLRHEIDDGIAEHRAHGFPATSFAPPFHASTPQTRKACAARFEIVRGQRPGDADPEVARTRVYSAPGRHRMVHNIGNADAQRPNFHGWAWQETLLDTIAEAGGVGVFAGHNLLEEDKGAGSYSTHEQLARFLGLARDRGLRFYTLTEFARLSKG
jgi:peptidoglycan/xylan/chitin deacetylase (PgdA/CDA1 family)